MVVVMAAWRDASMVGEMVESWAVEEVVLRVGLLVARLVAQMAESMVVSKAE